ncbi:hypothetical protein DY000_02003177 [Brassica cretica]|uniref:Uncharacterized protein n=1 Tax=Brassica cretica TaxID=69181 RepID=A0ABQ7C8D7_BRACR|nr:hypothetical protein DY000_02003177 [Brassica cretica]
MEKFSTGAVYTYLKGEIEWLAGEPKLTPFVFSATPNKSHVITYSSNVPSASKSGKQWLGDVDYIDLLTLEREKHALTSTVVSIDRLSTSILRQTDKKSDPELQGIVASKILSTDAALVLNRLTSSSPF